LTPSLVPSSIPSLKPSQHPSLIPSTYPSDVPSLKPSQHPSDVPSLQPSACIDESGWATLDPTGTWSGKTCTDIAELEFWCSFFFPYPYHGKTPYEACCSCGGGTHVPVEPSSAPSVVLSVTPSMSPQPSLLPSQIPSNVPSACVDESSYIWFSDLGFGCAEMTASFCADFAAIVVNGKTATTACCICGGGTHVPP
jgi:hypothetical protein